MRKQVAQMVNKGVWKVIYDDSQRINPYRVIYVYGGKQRQVERYGDMLSAMLHLMQSLENREEEG